jgi:hypothetical protein
VALFSQGLGFAIPIQTAISDFKIPSG